MWLDIFIISSIVICLIVAHSFNRDYQKEKTDKAHLDAKQQIDKYKEFLTQDSTRVLDTIELHYTCE